MSEQLYRCFSTGTTKRKLLPADSTFIEKTQELIDKNPSKDFYESIYLYNKSHFDTFQKTGSLAGLKDGVKTDRIVFDFDSKDIELARKDAHTVLNRLYDQLQENIGCVRIFYSANKGFHLEIHLETYVTRSEFESIVEHYAGDLETFDHKIKDEQRLFRFPLTRHNVSGRYKIPLTIDQLDNLTIEEIQELSQAKDHTPFYEILNSYTITPLFVKLDKLKKKEKKVEKSNVASQTDRPDMSRKPKHLTSAKYALQEGFFGEGERNEACLILASTYKFLGYNEELAHNMLKATLRLRARRLGLPDVSEVDKSEIWRTVINTVYSPNWKGGVYSEEENALLKRTVEMYNLNDEFKEKASVNITEVSDRFIHFASNIDKNTIKTGVNEIDENVLITTGMMVGYLGAPSSGKTSDVISFLEHQSKNNIGSFFVSADMPDNLLYARLLQRYCGWDVRRILQMVKDVKMIQWDKELKDAWDQVSINFRNVGFSFQSGPRIEDIKFRIEEFEQLTGNKVRVAAIDYLEKVRCDINDATAASGFNASRLADLTRDKDMATILLLQPQKSAGDPSDALLSMRKIKGASVIEQDCRVVMTKWRPGFNPDCSGPNRDDQYSSIAIVKNNMGPTLRLDMHWDGARGTMRSLTNDEKRDFKRVVDEAAMRKNPGLLESDDGYASRTSSKKYNGDPLY